MKNLVTILLLISSNLFFSQEKKEEVKESKSESSENGKIENGVYICDLIEWEIAIPEGYQIIKKERIEELEKKGLEAIKKEVPNGIIINGHPPQLIGFQLDRFNYFKSSLETLVGKKKFTLEEHKLFTEKLLRDTYSNIKELKYELTKSDLQLGKHNFYKIEVKIYSAKDDRHLLTQELYNAYINNSLFSASINYTKESVGMILNYNFEKSFEKQ
ncbi:hypothetical protein G6N05_07255 [Flavobacterium sp. F372]|uniref:Uncharacterized protein n=1 Tax=Flavobacterium bernardetii TaxID=2813823 RepID=A0ABR7IXL5_9FLAO|nr:hypothetical protein [Flavobacterium bernardetii]MBC5834458.1 hypothetical protein [Flavobacterium bernardetii]NHF69903.1 hypothetical protein [Flavobacterium bernardetii]